MKHFDNLVEEHRKVIYKIFENANKDNLDETLENIYRFIKEVQSNYYLDNYMMHENYDILIAIIVTFEERYCRKKLLDVSMKFKLDNDFISVIVQKALNELMYEHSLRGDNRNIGEIDFTNDCRRASNIVGVLCDNNGIENHKIAIYPGYSEIDRLYDGSGYHFANIIKYDNNYYLIDVTYSQFFNSCRGNSLDRLGVVYLSGCGVGCYAVMDEVRRDVSISLLENGYIKLNEENFKAYMDSFTLSFRNGLYYESNNDFSFTTDYTVDDYIKFLKWEDNQIIHEGRENLGYQMRPLRNPKLEFRKR